MLVNSRPDLMMPYFHHKKYPTFGKHSITQFEVMNAGVHCNDSLADNFVTMCLFKVETFFFINMVSDDLE